MLLRITKVFFNFLVNRILYFTQFGVFWFVVCLVFLRSLECASLKFLPILEKADQTFDPFSRNRTNSEVSSKPMAVPEYVVYITFSELIVSFVENRNML